KVLADLRNGREALVRVLDELPRRVPDGVNLDEVKQQAEVLQISGTAVSSARVSEFLRRLDQSEVFSSVRLSVIKVDAKVGSQQGQSFVLEADMQKRGGR
ncbi:MAG: PilN domain-containing protein, partial [Gammaproteobacteria bacterium]|nr:PilN domain-containing protein [Gammaproteobacteria bacterium]